MGRFKAAWAALTQKRPKKAVRRFTGASLGHADQWRGVRAGPNREIINDLAMLRARSRDLAQNDPHGSRLVDALVNSIVSTGVRPTLVGDFSPEEAEKVYNLWEEWGKRPLEGSELDIYGVQRLICRSWLVSGEVFAQFVPVENAKIPLKIRVLEADFVPLTTPGRQDLVGGVEIFEGERVAYYVYPRHPNENILNSPGVMDLVRVPAGEMLHCYRMDRPGQVRGVPVMAPILLALWDLEGYMEAVRVGTRAAATLVMAVEGGNSDPAVGIDGINVEDSIPYVHDQGGQVVERLGPGTVVYLPDGKDVKFTNPQPPGNIEAFLTACLRQIATGVGLSYHVLTGDMSDASFAQAKLGLIEQEKHINALRETIFKPLVLDKIWSAFIRACRIKGLIERNYEVTWSAPRSPSADRLTELKASQLAIRLGLSSITDEIESLGRDPDDVWEELSNDYGRLAELGIVSDANPAQTSLSGGKQGGSDTEKVKENGELEENGT